MVPADKHIFAIHNTNFWKDNFYVGLVKKLNDLEIVHRLVKVLRFEIGQKIIFFDSSYHGIVEIVDVSKKDLSVKILNFDNNIKESSEVVFLLPLLKKEALEEAVYSLTEIGISQIQLVVTEKSRHKLLHEKEFHRLESIIIAAAEQSKNYTYPKIFTPIHLSEVVYQDQSLKIVFDPQGESFFNLRNKKATQEKIYLLVGPEGGLTFQELQKLENDSFEKYHLTSTILRAVQAVAVGAALFKI